MHYAEKEMKENCDEDEHEFDELAEDEEQPSGNPNEGDGDQKKLAEDAQGKKLSEGIGLTHAEIKKHEEIDWRENSKLNAVTKGCISYTKDNFSFEEYLLDRALKDPKYVDLEQEEQALNEPEQDLVEPSSSESQMSEMESEKTAITGREKQLEKKPKWNRELAEEFYSSTKQNICE